jgi:hypothetical protein
MESLLPRENKAEENMESLLPGENKAKEIKGIEDLGEIYDQLMDLRHNNLLMVESYKEINRLYRESSKIQEYLLWFCKTQLDKFQKLNSEENIMIIYKELQNQVQAEDPENYR